MDPNHFSNLGHSPHIDAMTLQVISGMASPHAEAIVTDEQAFFIQAVAPSVNDGVAHPPTLSEEELYSSFLIDPEGAYNIYYKQALGITANPDIHILSGRNCGAANTQYATMTYREVSQGRKSLMLTARFYPNPCHQLSTPSSSQITQFLLLIFRL